MTTPEEDSSVTSEMPTVPMVRTLRTAALAEMLLAEHPERWVYGLQPLAPSLVHPGAGIPSWTVDALKALDIDRAMAGGPALVFARAVLEDFGQVVLDLIKVAPRAAGKMNPHLTTEENLSLVQACSAAHRQAFAAYEALDMAICSLVAMAYNRSESETRPES